MDYACLKTIDAFLNTDGGHLLIGVNDKGEPLGIENDRFPSEDKMNLHLFNLLRQRVGKVKASEVTSRFGALGGKRVLVVRCSRSKSPVYLKDDNTEQFFIRTGSATVELLPSEIQRYIKQRFHDTVARYDVGKGVGLFWRFRPLVSRFWRSSIQTARWNSPTCTGYQAYSKTVQGRSVRPSAMAGVRRAKES